MDYEDSRNALFPEPNAYIQNFNRDKCEPKKVVFQEPYDTLPNFYLDNNFKRGNCDCIPKPKPKPDYQNNQGGFNFPFNLKGLLPLLGGLGGNNTSTGGGLGGILSMLSGAGSQQSSSQSPNNSSTPNFDFSKILSSLGTNGFGDILNLFKPKSKDAKKEIKSSNLNIKNFTRVE